MCSILRPIHGVHHSVRSRRRHIATIIAACKLSPTTPTRPSSSSSMHQPTLPTRPIKLGLLYVRGRNYCTWHEIYQIWLPLPRRRSHSLVRTDSVAFTGCRLTAFFITVIKFTIESSYTYLRNEYWLATDDTAARVWGRTFMRMSTSELRHTQTATHPKLMNGKPHNGGSHRMNTFYPIGWLDLSRGLLSSANVWLPLLGTDSWPHGVCHCVSITNWLDKQLVHQYVSTNHHTPSYKDTTKIKRKISWPP